jgi:hypothetical protein
MKTPHHKSNQLVLAGAVAIGLFAGSLAMDGEIAAGFASIDIISAAHAESGGKGGQPAGTGQPADKGGPGGTGGQAGGSKSVDDVLRAAPDQTGGQGGPDVSSSGVILGRLSMAKAYAAPNFDPARVDDPEAPLANLEAYRTILLEGMVYPADGSEPFAVEATLDNLAEYLAKVATAPIAGDAIETVNSYLDEYQDGGVTAKFDATGISAAELAEKVNELVKENREEEEH